MITGNFSYCFIYSTICSAIYASRAAYLSYDSDSGLKFQFDIVSVLFNYLASKN